MLTDQQRYELRKIELDARLHTVDYGVGYPLTMALATLAGCKIRDTAKITRVAIHSTVGEMGRVTVEQLATNADGEVVVDPVGNIKHKWKTSTFDDRPKS